MSGRIDPDLTADNDRLESIGIALKQALFVTLKAAAWPSAPDAPDWHIAAHAQRLEAARIAGASAPEAGVGHPCRATLSEALRQIADEHEIAKALEPSTPKAAEPQPLPESCRLKMRQLLEVSEIPTRLDLWGVAIVCPEGPLAAGYR